MKIIQCNWDEFNSYPSVNFYYKYFLENPYIVIFEGYECLFPLIPNKIIIKRPKEIYKLPCDERDDLINIKILQLVKPKDIITQRTCIDTIHGDTHLYKFLFSSYTKFMIENKKHLFESCSNDNDYVKQLIKKINKPVVCINGRNLKKLPNYNNTLENVIKYLIENGIYVINCTFDKPNFNFDSSCYWEPGELIESYNINCSLFSMSDYVISIGNSGSITTHLMTPSNIIILGSVDWIGNKEFGFNGETMLSAREKYLPYKTKIFTNYNNTSNYENQQILKTILNEIQLERQKR